MVSNWTLPKNGDCLKLTSCFTFTDAISLCAILSILQYLNPKIEIWFNRGLYLTLILISPSPPPNPYFLGILLQFSDVPYLPSLGYINISRCYLFDNKWLWCGGYLLYKTPCMLIRLQLHYLQFDYYVLNTKLGIAGNRNSIKI